LTSPHQELYFHVKSHVEKKSFSDAMPEADIRGEFIFDVTLAQNSP
jgi:hypothetical protein